ncbi:hypothetical protein REPUB_Repub06bG0003100 [Reevesia pubescens]
MASTSHVFSAAILLLLIASYFIFPSYGITQDFLRTICSQTQNMEICGEILGSDPRTESADLPLLSVISLELAMKQAYQNYITLLELHVNSTDPTLEASFAKCLVLYKDLKHKLEDDLLLSLQKQFKNITNLGGLTTLVIDCENGIPLNAPANSITRDMFLTMQSAIFVHEFVSRSA